MSSPPQETRKPLAHARRDSGELLCDPKDWGCSRLPWGDQNDRSGRGRGGRGPKQKRNHETVNPAKLYDGVPVATAAPEVIQSGYIQSEDNQPGDIQPGEKQSGDEQPGDIQSKDKQSGDIQ